MCLFGVQTMQAQPNYGDLLPLHVNGKFLVDSNGDTIVPHGVMDTPSPYFNSHRWGWNCDDGSILSCVAYFKKLFTAMTDHEQGAYCTVFRLHLDPCWTNDPNKKATDGGGENDISRYSGARLTKYMKSLYWRIAEQGLKKGLYIIMRPPGVCPHTIQVGGEYQQYLLDVWDRVTKNDSILKYYGQVSIELANEPIQCVDARGIDNYKALHDFFQPIVDKIRANGFKGVIWVPGTGYQSNYRAYSQYPITDELNNIGYAVHVYSGWYGQSDDNASGYTFTKNFGDAVPVVKKYPVMITEIDWSPLKEPKELDHYNEFDQPVYKNCGTWATASTSKWGKAWKTVHDFYKNIGMTLTGTSDYLQIDPYIENKKVIPFAQGNQEACGEACFAWYKEWYEKTEAAKVANAERRALAVESVENDADEVSSEIYSLDGRKLTTLAKGVNIVRTKYSDGTVKNVKVYK